MKDSLPYEFHLGVALFSSSLGKKGGFKVCKLGLNRLIVLGCCKRFLSDQSSSYESLYQGLGGFRFLWVGFVSIKILVFGGENCVKPGNSGYKPGYFGFGTLRGKTPGINPEIPEITD